jgi:LAO/AO transport system kinase
MRNPHLHRKSQDQTWEVDSIFEGIRKGDRLSLSKGITLIESRAEKHEEKAAALLERCIPFSGRAKRIGITGSPGVGKSSWIEEWGLWLIERGHAPAVLAIDPSSSISKGSLLGDKTRMTHLSRHPKAFIRPSPANDTLGGVAHSTKESIILCEAAGFDTIIIETVGVGQSETMVRQMVDFFFLLILPGSGDDLQGIKRGIVELADLIAIHKADGDRVALAKRTKKDFRNALHLFAHEEGSWIPSVITASAFEKQGLDTAWEIIEAYYRHKTENGSLDELRNHQNLFWFENRLNAFLLNWLQGKPEIAQMLQEERSLLAEGTQSTTTAINHVKTRLRSLFKDS